ncbi:helix-turn-helix transcriptional regulator [Actinomadura fibrosa]|uniref:Helix-turn-helix transcriptional regulator n=1 Tax=Actinomadura fibrosa TaxID=111802 RepID=A0ABW2XER8_9ACTN|nr:helix-turn-helix transcriptional regulator [Actinomadura fibrosa]
MTTDRPPTRRTSTAEPPFASASSGVAALPDGALREADELVHTAALVRASTRRLLADTERLRAELSRLQAHMCQLQSRLVDLPDDRDPGNGTGPSPDTTTSGTSPTYQGLPATLRRALAFVDAHAHQDITLADIATAAGVTPRALQYSFRHHTGLSPLTHLRQIRLQRAHHDLTAADPVDGATVAAIAARWHFRQPGRFAVHYRAAYGRSPRSTLHTPAPTGTEA